MKRISLLLAPALLLGACASEVTDDGLPEGSGTPIAFQTPQTRAAIEGTDDMKAFSVWGWYTPGTDASTPANVFDGKEVTRSSGNWTYQGLQYWISGKTYDFYAVYPTVETLTGDGCTVNCMSDGVLTVEGFTVPTNIPQQTDLLYASDESVNHSDTGDPVAFSFQHALTNIQFSAKLADGMDEGYSVDIHSVVLYAANQGNMTRNSGGVTWTPKTFDGEDNSNPNTECIYVLNTTQGGLANNADITPSSGTVLLNADDYDLLMIPQQVADTKPVVAINYTLSYNGNSTGAQWRQIRLSGTNTNWNPGERLNYTLEINDQNVYLSLAVADWEEGNTGDTDITFE